MHCSSTQAKPEEKNSLTSKPFLRLTYNMSYTQNCHFHTFADRKEKKTEAKSICLIPVTKYEQYFLNCSYQAQKFYKLSDKEKNKRLSE